MQTILIIDDDRDMCLLLKRFLTRHGYEVLEAYNGKKALELLETVEPSLVMCDFRLEDMEGNVLLGKIKERYPHMPVIIITGYSDIKIAVEVMKLGAYDYITKPIIPGEIILTINNALKQEKKQPVHVIEPAAEADNEKAEEANTEATASQYIFQQSPALRKIVDEIS